MFPDAPTVVLMSALLTATLGLLLLWLWRRDRTLHALIFWGVSYLLAAAGSSLLAARHALPLWLSIDIAVACIVLGYGFGWIGARRLEHRPIRPALVVAGPVLWLAACQVPLFYQSQTCRAVLGSCLIGLYDALCAWEFSRKRGDDDLPSRRALVVVFASGAAIQSLRAAIALSLGLPTRLHAPDFRLPSSGWFMLPAALGTALGMATSVLLIAVAREKAAHHAVAVLAAARDAADRANVAKSRFLARMSHELRTPLNAVLGMAQVLTRDPLLSRAQKDHALLLEQSGRHLLAIINDILDLASVESGKFQLAPQPARVDELLRSSVDLVTGSAMAKRIALEVHCEADLPAAVLGDPLRIRQILLNLLGNAIKFTPEGGTVWLRASRLGVRGGLRFSVSDTGPGVPAEFRPHLFQDFAQRPMDASGAGTGLGLAISATLAQAMGGRITYQARPEGPGSVFIVTLPLAEATTPAAVVPAAAPAGMAAAAPSLRVLVVDDVVSNRRLADALLRQAGHEVWLAADAAAALAMLADGPLPDVVLMDVQMPGMDGLAATRRIRAMPGDAARLPVIALTADASRERADDYRAAGMDGFVTKPIMLDELAAAMASTVPRRALVDVSDLPVPVSA